jgi:hypothetical protein
MTELILRGAVVTGYAPLQFPGQPGILVAHEPVTWSPTEQDWIGPDDVDDVAE